MLPAYECKPVKPRLGSGRIDLLGLFDLRNLWFCRHLLAESSFPGSFEL